MKIPLFILLNLDSTTAGVVKDSLKTSYLQQSPISAFTYIKVFFLLLLVVALILFAVWALKKIAPQFNRSAGSGIFKVVASYYLAPKKSLYLVQLGNRLLLLGVTDDNINLLADFSDPADIQELQNALAASKSEPAFATIFASFIQKNRGK